MCNWRFGVILLSVGMTAACASSRQMQREDLKSAAAELQSLAAEGALFSEFVADGHATSTYSSGHPEYLRELADSNAKTLAESKAPPGLQDEFDSLRELSRRLRELINS